MTRTGKEYVDGLKDGRHVVINGEVVRDVAAHPAFRGAVESIARLYDMVAAPENRDSMTFTSPATGAPVNLSYLIPRSKGDLKRRRIALRKAAESSFGLMGRGPEHVAGFLAGWAGRSDIFEVPEFPAADNVRLFYEHARDNDLYCTYAIVPPQIDRSKSAHEQADPHLYAGIKSENSDGVIIAGAQQLATGAAISDYLILSCIVPLTPGDENYAISVAVPIGSQGLKIYSRRSYADAASSVFDYPLASQFDETDALVVFDDVFVPWDRVFVHKDLKIVAAQWNNTPAHLLGNNQAQIRFAVKLDFLAGLAYRVAQMNGSDKFPPVRGMLGEIAAYASVVSGLVFGQEQNCEVDEHGVAWPGRAECFANMTLQSELYPRVLHIVRELCGGGLIQLPSSVADFANPEAAADIERYIQSPGVPARDRVKLMKLVWEMVGSEFAGRHEQYEMFYAGAPFLVKSRMAQVYDFGRATALADRALGGYDVDGRLDADALAAETAAASAGPPAAG